MKISVVFAFVTIVVLFQCVYADVKPITLTELEKSSDIQLKSDSVLGEKLLRVPRTVYRVNYPNQGGYGGCYSCGGYGGYGGYGAYGGNRVGGSYSQSSSSSSSSSSSYGKRK
ncbi:protein suex-1-like [Chrysoperla carnea]|uniref:protein suex-1-like n=1 Tax=Chrysoperla carnea TaxID=189513 RepID=UPI001D05E084|nr:protein suex-1-like [Chrysoperla carnea]